MEPQSQDIEKQPQRLQNSPRPGEPSTPPHDRPPGQPHDPPAQSNQDDTVERTPTRDSANQAPQERKRRGKAQPSS